MQKLKILCEKMIKRQRDSSVPNHPKNVRGSISYTLFNGAMIRFYRSSKADDHIWYVSVNERPRFQIIWDGVSHWQLCYVKGPWTRRMSKMVINVDWHEIADDVVRLVKKSEKRRIIK